MVGKIRRMIAQNSFPEARMRVSRLSMGPPVPYPVSFRLIGPDIAELRRLVLPMRDLLEAEPTAQSYTTELGDRAPALRFRFDQEIPRQIGLSPDSVTPQRYTLTPESRVTEVREDTRRVEVVSPATESQR